MESGKKEIKYLTIKNHILRMIQEGQYRVGDRLPSEQELAQSHAVSVITSKKALDELEREGLISRVKGSGSFVAASQPIAGPNHVKMIAMVLPLGSDTGGGLELFYSVEMIAKSHGYYVTVENTHSSSQREREILLSLLGDGIEGIIYYPMFTAENFDLIKKLTMEKYPIVIIDKAIHDIEVDSVRCDNYNASLALTRHLIACGHRNIAFVSENVINERSSLRERFLGYSDALAEAGILLNLDNVLFPGAKGETAMEKNERTAYYKSVADHVLRDRSITALQVSSDRVAVELMRVCVKKGISVPKDVSIVGFDDLDVASYITPALTTAKQNFRAIGQTAAELVIGRLKNKDRKAEKVLIPAELIVRKSVQQIEPR